MGKFAIALVLVLLLVVAVTADTPAGIWLVKGIVVGLLVSALAIVLCD